MSTRVVYSFACGEKTWAREIFFTHISRSRTQWGAIALPLGFGIREEGSADEFTPSRLRGVRYCFIELNVPDDGLNCESSCMCIVTVKFSGLGNSAMLLPNGS